MDERARVKKWVKERYAERGNMGLTDEAIERIIEHESGAEETTTKRSSSRHDDSARGTGKTRPRV